MKNLKMFFALSSIAMMILGSCSKYDPITEDTSFSTSPTIEDNYLVFKDRTQLEETFNLLEGFTEAQYISWEKDLGFSTKSSILRKQIANGEEPEFTLRQMAMVLNTDGIVKISNNIYKFEDHRVICVVDGDLKALESAASLDKTDEEKNIYISEIESTLIRSSEGGSLKSTIFSEELCYYQPTSGLPRYYYTDIKVNSWAEGPAPVQGYYIVGFEVNVRGVAIRLSPTQGPLYGSYSLIFDESTFSHIPAYLGYPVTYTHDGSTTNVTNNYYIVSKTVASGGSFETSTNSLQTYSIDYDMNFTFRTPTTIICEVGAGGE
ncbi:hypothetical protein ES708_17592 [subsurface metagenome]